MTKPEIIISLPIFFSESLWINLLQYLLFRPHTLCSCIQNMSKSHKYLLNNISMTWPFPIIHEETRVCQLYLQLLQHCSSFPVQMKLSLPIVPWKAAPRIIFIAPDFTHVILHMPPSLPPSTDSVYLKGII